MVNATARVSKTIDASPVDVWKTLTTSGERSYFLGATIETDWKIGSPIRFKGEWKGKKYEDKGEILEFEPAKRLGFSHLSGMSGPADKPENYHVVTFDLGSEGSKTKVVLTQSNLNGKVTDGDRKHREEYEKNWNALLNALDKAVVGE